MTRYDAINFLSVDWTEYSGPPYIQAVLNLMPVSPVDDHQGPFRFCLAPREIPN